MQPALPSLVTPGTAPSGISFAMRPAGSWNKSCVAFGFFWVSHLPCALLVLVLPSLKLLLGWATAGPEKIRTACKKCCRGSQIWESRSQSPLIHSS